MKTVWYDLRFALRVLHKDLGFTLTCVLTLAAGIGAATAIFSVVNTVLLKPLPYRDPGRLALIHERIRQITPDPIEGMPAPDILDFQKQTGVLESAAGFAGRDLDFSSEQGEPARVHAFRVSPSLFPLLGVTPLLGRTFTDEEDRDSRAVAVISHAFWASRFASNAAIIGKTVRIDRTPYEVIGVMRPSFSFPIQGIGTMEPGDLWLPMSFTKEERAAHGDNFDYSLIARLRPGSTIERTAAELQATAHQIHELYPDNIRGKLTLEAVVIPVREQVVRNVRPLLLLLSAAVFFLLLIACVNVAGLMLSRAAAREREFSVRMAIGAGRARVAGQLLAESILLAVSGGLLGVMLAWWGTALLASLTAADIPRISEVHVDLRVLAFSFALSLLTGILFGTVPALMASKADLTSGLREGGRGATTTRRRYRTRAALVVSEVALALVLLVGAGLFLRSFLQLRSTDPGFQTARVLSFSVSLPTSTYQSASDIQRFEEGLYAKLSQLPGVLGVTEATDLPLIGSGWTRLITPLGGAMPGGRPPLTAFTLIKGGYFETLGIRLKQGRLFTSQDRNPDAAVVVISEAMASHLWPGQNAIGKQIKWGPPQGESPVSTVVGIVSDVKDGALDKEALMHSYEPMAQASNSIVLGIHDLAIAVHSSLPAESLAGAVRGAVRSLDSQMPISHMQTMEHAMDDTLTPRRFQTAILGGFACVALLLAALGIYGVITHSVTQRTKEIGIRVALGATREGVLGLILRQALVLSGTGIAIGTLCAALLTKYLSSLLFGVKATDEATFGSVAVILLLVTAAASLVPCLRAMNVDPISALRRE